MKYLPRIIHCAFLLTLTSIASCASPQDESEKTTSIPPPTLVECRTDSNCDRDPEHLEAFVAGFYKWSAANEAELLSFSENKWSPEELHKQIENFAKNEEQVMQSSLTPEFYHWTTLFSTEPPPAPDPRYCFGGGAILCFDGGGFKQNSNVLTKVTTVGQRDAKATATFPDFKAPINLIVQLRVADGFWRIDGVTRSSHDGHSDK